MTAHRCIRVAGDQQIQTTIQNSWKGRTVRIQTFPVRRIVTHDATPDGYIAIVRVERNGDVLVDGHLPFFAERWLSEAEARTDALEYAVKLIEHDGLDASWMRKTPL